MLAEAVKDYVQAHVRASGIRAHVNRSRTPDAPPQQITVTPSGGRGPTTEGAFERPGFRVTCRGRSDEEAESLADEVDRAFTQAPTPFELGGRWTISMSRASQPPGVTSVTEQGWVEWACDYIVEAESREREDEQEEAV